MIALAAGVHFLHYALFQEALVSLYYYVVTFLVLLIGAGAWLSRQARAADGHAISLDVLRRGHVLDASGRSISRALGKKFSSRSPAQPRDFGLKTAL